MSNKLVSKLLIFFPFACSFALAAVGQERPGADQQQTQYQLTDQDSAKLLSASSTNPAGTDELTTNGLAARDVQQSTSPQNVQPKSNPPKNPALVKKVAGSHKGVFYDNDFSYLKDPNYSGHLRGDNLKNLEFGECWTVDVGGQYRLRYHNAQNVRGLGLTGNDDDWLLHRTRVYANAKYSDYLRLYAEYIDAESNYENFAPLAIDVNRSDMLNLFADVKLIAPDQGDLWLRAGRQELLYGSQRLVSPLDWGNTRRTFDGYKFLWKGESWDVDSFWTRPVTVDTHNFDAPNLDEEFAGVVANYKDWKEHKVSFYGLKFIDHRPLLGVTKQTNLTTVGGQLEKSDGEWLWDFEGAVQSGTNANGSDHIAGMWTAGIGKKFEGSWKPTLWFYYDWASGDDATGAGNGFDHLFPLAHRYLGLMDLYGRRNIEDANVLFTVQPNEKWNLQTWYHYFALEDGRDTPYNVNLTPFNGGNTPASSDLGHELDLLAIYKKDARTIWNFGYSHFFAGSYYHRTAGVPTSRDGNFYYVQLELNF